MLLGFCGRQLPFHVGFLCAVDMLRRDAEGQVYVIVSLDIATRRTFMGDGSHVQAQEDGRRVHAVFVLSLLHDFYC